MWEEGRVAVIIHYGSFSVYGAIILVSLSHECLLQKTTNFPDGFDVKFGAYLSYPSAEFQKIISAAVALAKEGREIT
jgi:hypothetical protein